jgi:hypothetical protein
MQDARSIINKIKTRDDFIQFLSLLLADLKGQPHYWENNTLESYLEALASWTEDMDGYYINTSQPVPQDVNWKVFADILMAATMYE